MKKTLEALNELQRAAVIGRFAIGGAMGAAYFVEPTVTFDLDVFVQLPEAGGGLVTLAPLYAALRGRGYVESGEFVVIENVPVQFLPVYDPLIEEAVRAAIDVTIEGVPTRIMTAEHLNPISLQTGRDKDRDRLRMFLKQANYSAERLDNILNAHGLAEKWQQWMR